MDGITRFEGHAVLDPKTVNIRVNDEFTVSVVLSRCQETGIGSFGWTIRLDTGLVPDITIAVSMISSPSSRICSCSFRLQASAILKKVRKAGQVLAIKAFAGGGFRHGNFPLPLPKIDSYLLEKSRKIYNLNIMGSMNHSLRS